MILTDLLSMVLRVAELVFAAIVAGVNGHYLRMISNTSDWHQARFIYTEVVAGLAMLLALIWLFPFSGSFVHWPVDLFISICWFAAFGVLVHYLDGSCGRVFAWGNVTVLGDNPCGRFKAIIAFSFLSAICWLVSAIIGVMWVRDHENRYRRRTWHRSRV
ncbi:hypothetical protein DL764_008457 [Monosporascus ibericus]|uniref:MARVEL domain-containing protein n=1 Tax=Monosporascus ibericus TaxID=155417 RepID=A0A4Q4SXH5_9PEZI|nr:hypothetical protein DL764_008457 [Monosporascus ibericus]